VSTCNGFLRIDTARLGLRRFSPADAQEVQLLAGDCEIAESTLLPHPYLNGMAESWLAKQAEDFASTAVNFAIERSCDATLIGSIGLELDLAQRRAKLGCWVGRPYWGRGYCTEAVEAVIAYGFETFALERIWAARFSWNAASARVLDKSGFAQEGCRREYVAARGRKEIVVTHGLLRWEWEAHRTRPASGHEPTAFRPA
jgi:[ribosomal protein S5]-alanine N-acetyltransferase